MTAKQQLASLHSSISILRNTMDLLSARIPAAERAACLEVEEYWNVLRISIYTAAAEKDWI